MHPADWAIASGAVDDVLNEMAVRLRRRTRRRVALAATAVALVMAAVFLWRSPVPRPAEAPVIVALPEHRTLPDGSNVDLKSGAVVNEAFSEQVRRVVLTRGEAHFQVKKDSKPFIVSAGGIDVRAVGTAFTVQFGSAGVEVVVTEGQVAVERPASESVVASPGANETVVLARVAAGNRIDIPTENRSLAPESVPVVPVDAQEIAAKLAWRAPRLEFSHTPLASVLSEMKAHSAGEGPVIELGEESLARLEVSGVLGADNVDTLLRFLADQYGVTAEQRDPQYIVLHRARK